MEEFKKYFKFPLKMDDVFPIKVFTSENNMAFDWLINIPVEVKKKFLAIINGQEEVSYKVKKEFYHKDDGIVYCKLLSGDNEGTEYKLFRIRGWGMLTGTGGYNLDPEYAATIQDAFTEYCIKMLNK